MVDITEKLYFKGRVIFFSPLCKQLVKPELESMIPQLAQLLSLLLLLAFQPLSFTNTFDAVLVLECSYLVLFTPCQSQASSRAHAVPSQLLNGLNLNARYSALFHCTVVTSVDLCCPSSSHTIRHYVKCGQQDFGENMTLAVCEQLGGNQGTIAWFYYRTLLKVTERRTQGGLLNLILLPERLTYKPVWEMPFSRWLFLQLQSLTLAPCQVLELLHVQDLRNLSFPLMDLSTLFFLKFPVVGR